MEGKFTKTEDGKPVLSKQRSAKSLARRGAGDSWSPVRQIYPPGSGQSVCGSPGGCVSRRMTTLLTVAVLPFFSDPGNWAQRNWAWVMAPVTTFSSWATGTCREGNTPG